MNVESGPPETLALTRYLREWPYRPGRRGRAGEADRLFVERVGRLVEGARHSSWRVSTEGELAGLALVERLEWDTHILGMSAARLDLFARHDHARGAEVVAALVERALDYARGERIQHLSARVDAEDVRAIQGLELAGFLNVDALMTFSATPADLIVRAQPSAFRIRPGSAEDATPLGEIAAETFVHGRFHADPSIEPGRARNVYRNWAVACCQGTAADAILVALDDDRIAGFVACRMHADTVGDPALATGTIPLIASASSRRGRGVGSSLVAAAARWFRNRGAVTVEVGTQLANVAAARLYERSGFRLVAGALSYRKMIEP